MNFTLITADRATYRKIVSVALLAATLVAIGALLSNQRAPAATAVQPDPFTWATREV